MLPMIEINTIGAGAGSIAWLDVRNGLHVGPQSAGAEPGPRRVWARRIRADRCRREHRAGPAAPRSIPRRPDEARPRSRQARNRGQRRLAARPEPRGGGGRNHPHRQCEHGARGPGQLRGEGIRPPRHHPRRVRGRRAVARGGARRRRRHSGRTGAAAAGGVLRRRTGDGRYPPRLRSDPGHARRRHHRRSACPALCRARSAGPRCAGAGRGRRGALRAATIRGSALCRAGLRGERAGLRRVARSGLDERGDRNVSTSSTSGSTPTLIPTSRSNS